MAARIGSLFVSLVADMSAFQPDMQRAAAITRTAGAQMRRDVGLTERSVRSLGASGAGFSRSFDTRAILTASRSFDTLNSRVSLLRGSLLATTSVFGGLGAALGANVLSRYADQFTGLQNQLRVVSKDTADLEAQTQSLIAVSNRARVSLSATATLYSRIAKASPMEGAERTLRRVETIQKALALGGATAAETYSASIQLSQGLASDRLGGEELRAVLETPLGLELARGLNMTIGQFREAGHAGRLTADMIYKSLDRIATQVDGQFANSLSTIDQALAVLDNNMTEFVGNTDKAYGVSRSMASGIGLVANNLDTLIPLLATAGGLLATGFIGKRIGAAGTGIVANARQELAARRDAVATARAAQAAAVADVRSSMSSLATAQADRNVLDPRSFADKSVLNAYRRDATEVQKLDAQRLDLLQKQGDAVRRLGENGRTVTPAMIRAAQEISRAEASVNAELRNQQTLRRSIDSQSTRLTAMLGQQATFTGSTQGLKKLEGEIAQAQRIISDSQQKIVDSERVYARESLSLAAMRAADQRGIVREVAASLSEQDRLGNQLVENERRRGEAVARLSESSAAARANGSQATARALQQQVAAVANAQSAMTTASQNLAVVTQRASAAGVAMGALRSAGGSLLSFLGGPWGVAFAAASAALVYFGMRSQEAAVRAERIRQEMRNLGITADETGDKIAGAAEKLDGLRAAQLRSRETDVRARLGEIFTRSFNPFRAADGIGDVRARLASSVREPGWMDSDALRKGRADLLALINLLEQGEVPADRLEAELDRIAGLNLGSNMDAFIKVVRDAAGEVYDLNKFLDETRTSLAAIDSGRTGRVPLQVSQDELQRQLDQQIEKSSVTIDEELRRSKLTDRQREIEDAGAQLAKAVRDAGGMITDAAATAYATTIIDNRDFQKSIEGGIFELIRKVEGTGPGTRGYNETLGNGKFTGGPVNLVNMSLNEVLELQKRMLAHPANDFNSSAVGAYQIVSKTLRGLMQELSLSGTELFDEGMQDRLAGQLLRRRGRNATGLGNEWQGIQFALRDGRLTEDQLFQAYDTSANGLGDMDSEVRKRNEEANEAIIQIEADKQNAYRQTIAALQQETAMLNLETSLIGQSEAAKQREVLIQETLNRLKEQEISITPEVEAAVRAEAEARFTAAQAAEAQKLSQEQLIERMDDLRSLSTNVFGGFLKDIRDGKGLLESLANALDKIADKIFDVFTDNFVTSMFGKKGGAGGGFLGSFLGGGGAGGGKGLLGGILIPGILHEGGRVGTHGMGGGRRVSSSVFAGAPRFHSGLTSREFPTILEEGERVLTARQEAKTAGVIKGLSAAAGGRAAGARVTINDMRTSSTADQVEVRESDDGREIEVYVRDIARDEVTTSGRGANQALRRGYGLQKGLVPR